MDVVTGNGLESDDRGPIKRDEMVFRSIMTSLSISGGPSRPLESCPTSVTETYRGTLSDTLSWLGTGIFGTTRD